MQYQGTLPADFDYMKELADYWDERYRSTAHVPVTKKSLTDRYAVGVDRY